MLQIRNRTRTHNILPSLSSFPYGYLHSPRELLKSFSKPLNSHGLPSLNYSLSQGDGTVAPSSSLQPASLRELTSSFRTPPAPNRLLVECVDQSIPTPQPAPCAALRLWRKLCSQKRLLSICICTSQQSRGKSACHQRTWMIAQHAGRLSASAAVPASCDLLNKMGWSVWGSFRVVGLTSCGRC